MIVLSLINDDSWGSFMVSQGTFPDGARVPERGVVNSPEELLSPGPANVEELSAAVSAALGTGCSPAEVRKLVEAALDASVENQVRAIMEGSSPSLLEDPNTHTALAWIAEHMPPSSRVALTDPRYLEPFSAGERMPLEGLGLNKENLQVVISRNPLDIMTGIADAPSSQTEGYSFVRVTRKGNPDPSTVQALRNGTLVANVIDYSVSDTPEVVGQIRIHPFKNEEGETLLFADSGGVVRASLAEDLPVLIITDHPF